MTLASRAALLLAVSVLPPATAAVAADYEPPIYVEPAEEYVPVEVGSGWYLRGDIAYNFETRFKNTRAELSGDFSEFAPFFPYIPTRFDEKETPVFGSVGFGYHFNDYLRADVNLGLLPKDRFAIDGFLGGGCTLNCDLGVDIEQTYWTGIANGYIDLGTYAGLTPYVGAGIGVLYSKIEVEGEAAGVRAEFTDRDYNFLYTLNAGLSYQIAANTSLDVGYQFLSAPDAQFIRIDPDRVKVGEGIDFHQVRVGLRYDLW
ncbi:porin family protein [Pseudaminobacter sp. 19-2017]|uniref:Porin family protein n=1 Tax=Pseudaminobacter soli (ex Zhang et al. 2022) TaxID=2831468 RepID=A0A942DVR2_9HYPH|nr:outer membrane beta-barrel protein [Pseudaminobacter soli]MBS3647924.1 porin family protein [Pseudaminobacter soli]